ncbi:MAG TPA: ATP-binding protein [Steroidobacteraceae bacterium]|nr:ATP-binding protein [Steroidobacteraceae bacterium]
MTGRKHLDSAMENKNSSILAMGNLLHSLDEVESVQDAFMLAADSNALFARTRAVRDVQSRLDELQSTDVTMYRQLNTSITDTIHALDAELSLYTKSGMQSVTQSGMPVRLLQQRQQSHDLANALISTVKAEMQSLRIQSSRNTVTLYILQIAIILLALGVLIWSVILMRSELRERQQKENQLRDINAYVESLLENIPAMIFIKDARDLRFVRINKAGESLLGISREEFVGKSDHDFFPPDQVEFFINKDREVLAQDKVVEIPEETIDTRNHGQRWLHTLKVPVMNVDKKPLLLLGISMDITTQKLAEQRIKALNVELEQKAKQLKVSNSELETFCYSVSHDLRAPLRTIEGFAQLLEENQRSSLDADSLRYLNTIRRSSKQMSQLIDDLLAYSKMGRQTITTEKLDMNLLAARATEIAAFGRNPRPEIIIDDLPNITGDETMISSVWLNLIDNAIKYSAKNIMPRIHISARSDDHTITYCVQDNGVGFDMQQYDKLFDVFQRLHSEREFTGTGLGLAIVERIISRHGGRVWAEGTPQQGATFYFSLSTEPAHAFS